MAAAQPLKIRMVAGLGNPGDEYAETRHNAGFKAIDELARQGYECVEAAAWPQGKAERKAHHRLQKEAEDQRRFAMKQQKRKDKHRGH